MEFEEMQMIWDSQNERHLFGIDEAGLHEILKQKSRDFRKMIRWQEFQSYFGTTVVVTAVLGILIANHAGLIHKIGPLESLTGWDILALTITVGTWLHFAVSVYLGGRAQARRERRYTSSLRDDLDREIEQTAYQIEKRRNILAGFLPPYVGAALLAGVTFRMAGLSQELMVSFGIVIVTVLVIETRSQRRLVREEMLPRQRELEALREKLIEAEPA